MAIFPSPQPQPSPTFYGIHYIYPHDMGNDFGIDITFSYSVHGCVLYHEPIQPATNQNEPDHKQGTG